MSDRASASRYAKALFEVVLKEKILDRADKDLEAFLALFKEHADLREVLTNPVLPINAKRGVIKQLIDRLKPTTPVTRLLNLLTDRNRFNLFPDLVDVYQKQLMDHRNVIQAELVTATPLSNEQAEQLEQRFSKATGRTVTMNRKVDKDILGGVTARLGSTVYDASIATQLARIRERLIAEG
jgi:F-type H+-transporting ATPase subunit delta